MSKAFHPRRRGGRTFVPPSSARRAETDEHHFSLQSWAAPSLVTLDESVHPFAVGR